MLVSVLLISTRKYSIFVQPLIDSIKKNFLNSCSLQICLFTDKISNYREDERVYIDQFLIPSYTFPTVSLYRYDIFDRHKEGIKGEYVFYIDCDMLIENKVGYEILFDGIVTVIHPGYYKSEDWGNSLHDPNSTSYLPIERRKIYFAGGFQGGKREDYLKVCHILSERIKDDERRGVTAIWHDESHFNWLTHTLDEFKYLALTPEYCMVQSIALRKAWGIYGMTPRIVALDKNHDEMRS